MSGDRDLWQARMSLRWGSKFMGTFATRADAVSFAQNEIEKNSGVGAMTVSDEGRAVYYDTLADDDT